MPFYRKSMKRFFVQNWPNISEFVVKFLILLTMLIVHSVCNRMLIKLARHPSIMIALFWWVINDWQLNWMNKCIAICNLTSNLPNSLFNVRQICTTNQRNNTKQTSVFWKIAPTASFRIASRRRGHTYNDLNSVTSM